MKRSLSALLHTIELLIGAILVVATAPTVILPIIFVGGMTIPASRLKNDIEGNNIKKSIFAVSSNGKITQNALAKPGRMLSLLSKKDKSLEFKKETMNMFLELNKTDKRGKAIDYHTRSHILTYRLLMELQRNGYIENLQREPSGSSRLIIEKLGMGNIKGIFSNKKTNMYNISFNLTNKERNYDDLISLVSNEKQETPVTQVSEQEKEVVKEANMSDIERKRAELLAMKKTLLEQKELLEKKVEEQPYAPEEEYIEEESHRHM